ncbi:MAG: hypothetical protein WCP97_01090 [bacterium]
MQNLEVYLKEKIQTVNNEKDLLVSKRFASFTYEVELLQKMSACNAKIKAYTEVLDFLQNENVMTAS